METKNFVSLVFQYEGKKERVSILNTLPANASDKEKVDFLSDVFQCVQKTMAFIFDDEKTE